MNGIDIPKKSLTALHLKKIERTRHIYNTQLEQHIDIAKIAGVGVSSVQKAAKGQELSEQIIDKIIKAL